MMALAWLSATLILLAAPADTRGAAPPAPAAAYAPRTGTYPVEVVEYDWVDPDRHRRVPARVYFPRKGEGPFPVIVVSHEVGGGRGGFEYLGRYWANHGYVAVHLQHAGSDVAMFAARPDQPKPDAIKVMQQIAKDKQLILTRALDVYFAFDQVEGLQQNDPLLRGRLALKRMAVAGHGVGAWTALAAAGLGVVGPDGQVTALPDPRIKALLLLNLPGEKERPNLSFGQVKVPAMQILALRPPAMGGGVPAATGDTASPAAPVGAGGTASPAAPPAPGGRPRGMSGAPVGAGSGPPAGSTSRQLFDHLAASDQYLLSFPRAEGAAFDGRDAGAKGAERDPVFQQAIRVSSTAFWDAYLKSDAAARSWLAAGGLERALNGEGRLEKRLKQEPPAGEPRR
jgi:hypothetical protein